MPRLSQRTGAAQANAASRCHPQGAIVFRSAFVRGKWTIGGATQGTVRLEGKRGARKPAGTRACGQWWRARDHRRDGRHRVSRSTVGRAHGCGRQMLAEFQPQVPEPWGQDLKTCVSERSARDPPIGVVLLLFIRENRLTGATMQGHIEHIVGAECWSGQSRGEHVGDHLCPSFTHRGGSSRGGTGGHQHADHRSRRRKRNVRARTERAGHLAFRMHAGRSRRPGQDGVYGRQVEHLGVRVARTHAQVRLQHIDKRSGSPREAIQADQDALTRDLHLCGRSGEDGGRPQPCTPILAIAGPANGSQKLMGVRVQHTRLSCLEARSASLLFPVYE
jgi:hypothetical protein